MADKFLPEKACPTLEKPARTEDNAAPNEREGRNRAAIGAWGDEESRRTEEEKRMFKGSTRVKRIGD